jgi:hypothetical protein
MVLVNLELFRFAEIGSHKFCLNELLQLRTFRLGLLQDGNVGVGVFPEGEEWNPNSPHRLSWGLATRGSSFPSAIHQILSVQH